MYYYYNKSDGQVRMVSADLQEFNTKLLEVVEIDDNEYEGYSMTYNNGELFKTKI